MTGIKICGTGSYLPDNVVDNNAYAKIVDTSDEWIVQRTGISTRHIANGDMTWRMGAKAAKRAIEAAGVSPESIGLIIITTVTPDYATPSMSCIIQNELGAVNAMCIDINCACAAYIYAMDMAQKYLAAGEIENVLIVSSELLSRLTDYSDRSTCVLFGDGAGATVLQRGEGLYGAHIGSDGSGYGLMFCKNPPPTSPFTTMPLEDDAISVRPEKVGHMVMGGSDIYKFATKMMPYAIELACKKAGITPADLDLIVPHQANLRIVQTAMKNIGLPMEKAYMTIDHTGNTSSATVPIALDEAVKAGRLKRGDKVCFVGFGSGLTYGAVVVSY